MPMFGTKASHSDTALDVHASRLFRTATIDILADQSLPCHADKSVPTVSRRLCSRSPLRKSVSCRRAISRARPFFCKRCPDSVSSFLVLTVIRSRFDYSRSNCGFSDCGILDFDLLRRGFGVCSVTPFGFSRCARISFARSRISFGRPASRATWIP